MSKNLLLLTSGGDASGMNAAIRSVVRYALHQGFTVYGCQGGYQGLISGNIQPLNALFVANCIQRGGTILQTGRFSAFKNRAIRQKAIDMLAQYEINYLIVLGGEGSFCGAAALAQKKTLNVVGIPCTIDNDIQGTDYTIGYDTARNTALQAIDKIRDTAFSINNHFLVEVMGRHASFLAVDVGIAGGAELILIPEINLTIEQLCETINQRKRKKLASIIVVAEANQPGRSVEIAKQIKTKTGIDYRVCILGHTQRGGSPTVEDRKVATLMGAKAVEALQQGLTNKMVAIVNKEICCVALPGVTARPRMFNENELLKVNQIICDL